MSEQSDTPRSTAIRDNIHVALVADSREQSISHLEEAHREIESMEKELTAARAELVAAYQEMEAIRIGTRLINNDLKAVTEQRDRLAEAIRLTLMENLDLCDGDVCTLKRLKDAIGFEDQTETTP